MTAAMTFTPRANIVHVRVTRPAEKSAGGIWLPQVREVKTTEGKVIATGPGRAIPGVEQRCIVWLLPGDTVLFSEEFLQGFRPSENEGLISEDHVLATVDPDTNAITPEGEFVLIDPDPAPRFSAHIYLPDYARRPPRSGILKDLGPGELRVRGELAGMRASPRLLWQMEPHETLIGRRVWWSKEATEYHAASRVLIRARDLICIEAAKPRLNRKDNLRLAHVGEG